MRRPFLAAGAVLTALTVAATGIAQTAADLAVAIVTSPAGPFAPSTSFTLNDTVLNGGGTDAGSSVTRYYLSLDAVKSTNDVRLVGSRSVSVVRAGSNSPGAVTVTLPSSVAAGTYTLFGCADDTRLIAEANETNNCTASATRLTVALPDLVATVVSNPPARVAAGGSLTITDAVQNISAVKAGASTTQYYLSTDSIRNMPDVRLTGSRNVIALDAGATSSGTKTLTVPSTTALGSYRVLACADDLRKRRESNENNNCVASAATVAVEFADLRQTSVGDPPLTATPGSLIRFTEAVQNVSAVTSPASTSRSYLSADGVRDAADVLIGWRSVGPLNSGALATANRNVQVPATMPLGPYRVLVCADDLLKVAESIETNNCAASSGSLFVGWPDLVTMALGDPPARLAAGRTFTVTETVQNQGTAAAAASTTRYYLSIDGGKDVADVLLSTRRAVGPLTPGAPSTGTVTLTVPLDIVPATYVLLACADDLASVPESNDGNNCRASQQAAVARANVLPVADAGPDQDVAPGALVQLDGSGSHDADMDPLIYTWSLLAVPPGSQADLSDLTSDTPALTIDVPGQYVVQLVVDDGKEYSRADVVTVTTGATRFAALGDTGRANTGQYQVASALETKCDRSGCAFLILLGDNIYESGVTSVTDPQFQTKFEQPYASIDRPFYLVLGNHDYGGGGEGNEFEKGRFEVEYTRVSSKWRMPAAYYRFTWNDVDFFGLDTNLQMYGLDAQQRADVDLWLQQSTSAWKIALGHHPYRSNGSHGNAGAYNRIVGDPVKSGDGVRSFMEQILCGRADFLLSGHDHNLQWLRPDGSCAGTELIVSGAGAEPKPLRSPNTAGYNETYFQAAQLGFAYFVVTAHQLTVQFIDGDGSLLYVRTVTRQP